MTDVALKEYLERRLDDLDRRLSDRFTLTDRSVTTAAGELRDRLIAMNEFRDALKDQASRMATRLELDKVNEEVQEIRRAKANLDGRLFVVSGIISALTAGLVATVMRLLLK